MRTNRLLTLAGLALGPVLVLAVFFVLPISAMVARGFDDGAGAVLDVLGRPRTHRVLWFTVWSAGLATLVSLALGLPAAYVLHRLAFPLRNLIRALLLVPFVLPTVVVGVAFRLLVRGTPLDGSAAAIIAGLVFFNVAVVIRVVGAAWESLDPRPAEAAAALGASPSQVFRTVTLPALRPGGRVRGERRVPLLRDVVRRGAHPGRAALLERRDRDLPAHHAAPRPAGGRRAEHRAAARGHRADRAGRPAAQHAGPDRRPAYRQPAAAPRRRTSRSSR